MSTKLLNQFTLGLIFGGLALLFTSCGSTIDQNNQMLVSVRDQRLLLVRDGQPIKSYPVSTSKFGLGSESGSKRTPLGKMAVARKIGDGAQAGAVFKSRRPTGEVLKPNAPGRDPIVSRIIWLTGRESQNRNTYARFIYIHGTPEEWRIGQPASYGCIRMKSRDVIDLYNRVGVGAEVKILRDSLYATNEGRVYYAKHNKPAGQVALTYPKSD
ncbi:MAG: L,D-transpeptidase [Verrucomicrobia bacterium]|nr:L,D-transpeptidase [Verrucomicrobiota bacterium]MDA1006941.1 L,D-transpeptidase [Verrucomicrobiota bacterium]